MPAMRASCVTDDNKLIGALDSSITIFFGLISSLDWQRSVVRRFACPESPHIGWRFSKET